MKKLNRAIIICTLVCAILAGCVGTAFAEKASPIVVGSKEFTEQLIIGYILKDIIEGNTDYEVDLKDGLGGTAVIFAALSSDQIDVYVEYSGTTYGVILEMPIEESVDATFKAACQKLHDDYNIECLERVGFNDTYCLAMKRSKAEEYGITRISDLIGMDKKFIFAPSFEFNERADGLKKLVADYPGLEFADVVPLEGMLKYVSADSDEVDIICAFSTEGMLKKFDMLVLEDDRHSISPYEGFPIVRGAALESHPGLKEALNKLAGAISDDDMAQMNYLVDCEQRMPGDVAHEFLVERGLIPE